MRPDPSNPSVENPMRQHRSGGEWARGQIMKGCRWTLFSLFSQLLQHKMHLLHLAPIFFAQKDFIEICICARDFIYNSLLVIKPFLASLYVLPAVVCVYVFSVCVNCICYNWIPNSFVFGTIVFATIVFGNDTGSLPALAFDCHAAAWCRLLLVLDAGTTRKKEDKCAVPPTAQVSSLMIHQVPHIW